MSCPSVAASFRLGVDARTATEADAKTARDREAEKEPETETEHGLHHLLEHGLPKREQIEEHTREEV